MALGLRKSGCSIGASLAYWIGNPILNPATVIFMGFVLGWHWVGLRLAAGVVLVFGVAYVVQWLVHPEPLPGDAGLPTDQVAEADVRGGSIWTRWLAALWKLAVGLVPEYVVLVLLLGAARAWFFPAVDSNATGFLWTLGLALAGTLFVIPTAGEIPIVQTLMAFGLGVGPAAALMTTLPPVSLPSLAMLARAVPLKVLVFVTGAVVLVGGLSGAAAVALGF